MKDIKLSFPFPKTSRHNLSQDIAMSLSMGLVIPSRVVEVLPGDSHRIATSFSLISNPLVKPLLQGVRMRYCRFWVPRRIYHLDQRANNSGFDPVTARVRCLKLANLRFPLTGSSESGWKFYSNFQQSSLFDYLGYAQRYSNFDDYASFSAVSSPAPFLDPDSDFHVCNAEPYIAYIDICRNFFADSATKLIAWSSLRNTTEAGGYNLCVSLANTDGVDSYIDDIQNTNYSVGNPYIKPYNWARPYNSDVAYNDLRPTSSDFYGRYHPIFGSTDKFNVTDFGVAHVGFCVPFNRPDRMSRWFDLQPLTSQNAVIAPNEITVANLSFLSKLQRYLTRKFFGGSRFTDVMYSVFGQKVPHVDSPILLDVFDHEIGSELVASTNATDSQNPGTLGGFFSASGVFATSGGSSRRRYTFNEAGYLIDTVHILPRLFRSSFVSDFLEVHDDNSGERQVMQQGNFVPDFNGIGWQQPVFVDTCRPLTVSGSGPSSTVSIGNPESFVSEPAWQQYRTLPDVCFGALNPLRSIPAAYSWSQTNVTVDVNSPIFTFNDRPGAIPLLSFPTSYLKAGLSRRGFYSFSDPNELNRVFGVNALTYDNIFVVFRHSHQVKRQVSKRFTLSFS